MVGDGGRDGIGVDEHLVQGRHGGALRGEHRGKVKGVLITQLDTATATTTPSTTSGLRSGHGNGTVHDAVEHDRQGHEEQKTPVDEEDSVDVLGGLLMIVLVLVLL